MPYSSAHFAKCCEEDWVGGESGSGFREDKMGSENARTIPRAGAKNVRRSGERCSARREGRAVLGLREMAERGRYRERRTEWKGEGESSSRGFGWSG